MHTYYPISNYGDLSNMMYSYIIDRARPHFEKTAAEKAAMSSAEDVQRRQAKMKQAFLQAIGGLPEQSCDLEPVWGELRVREGYSVQNVMFKAAEDVYVTATVWRPVGWTDPRPGVLFACGHDEEPRAVPGGQRTCASFALNGYVTLAFDPPGQGERKLCWDPVLQQSFVGTGSAEHNHVGLQCELVGHNIARYFVRDGMRALDMLASLPEVDETRIAVTGYSGGGTQSSYLMLVDERLACGMPCIFTTAREIYVRRTHYHDAEQNLDRAIIEGLDYDDFYLCFAPKPAAIGAVTYDFFPIEGVRLTYERLRHVYALLGAEERIALFEVDSGHMYHPALCRRSIEWFNRWLQPGVELRELEDFEPEPPQAQLNTASGQVSVSVPNAKGVFDENVEQVRAAAKSRRRPQPAQLRRLLGIPEKDCPLNPRIIETYQEAGLTLEKGFIMAEPDIVVPVLRIAGGAQERAVVYCCDEGIEGIGPADEALLRKAAAEGTAVYIVEPRGTGETRSRLLMRADRQRTESWLSQHLRMLGTSTAALRAYDLLRAFEYVRSRQGETVNLKLAANGWIGWSAVLAAALDEKVSGLCLEAVRPGIAQFATTWTARVPEAYTIPGILTLADIPQLVAASKAEEVVLLQPRDTSGERICPAAWESDHAQAWKEAGDNIRVILRPDAVERNAVLWNFLAGKG